MTLLFLGGGFWGGGVGPRDQFSTTSMITNGIRKIASRS